MHDLISKYFQGTISLPEKTELFSLIEVDTELRKEFISVQNVLAITSVLPDHSDETRTLGRLRQFKRKCKKKKRLHSMKRISRYTILVAASILATWGVIDYSVKNENKAAIISSVEEFTTPAGQRAKIKLHDGTTVWLNANSTLRNIACTDDKERRVELNGEAFFDVINNGLPFVVSTEKSDIHVLGTQFNVNAYRGQEELTTSLLSGKIKIFSKENTANIVDLKPNELAEWKGNRWVKKSFSNMDFLLWKDGIYVFDDLSFVEIIKKLELYYETTIYVKNKKLETYKFTGKIRQRDGVESVLRTLQKVYYFSFVKDDDKNTITIR
jgi:ferric-dicitrate binding protein FerR (iron transport regulator)